MQNYNEYIGKTIEIPQHEIKGTVKNIIISYTVEIQSDCGKLSYMPAENLTDEDILLK